MLRKSLIALGVLVALVPYLGLPRSFDTVLTTFAGTAIVVLLIIARPRGDRGASFVPPTPSELAPTDPSSEFRPDRRNDRPFERPRSTEHRSTPIQPRQNPTKELHVERLATLTERPPRGLERSASQERKVPMAARPVSALVGTPVVAAENTPVRPRPARRKLASAQPVVGVIPAPETEVPQRIVPASPERKVEARRRRPKAEHAEAAPLTP